MGRFAALVIGFSILVALLAPSSSRMLPGERPANMARGEEHGAAAEVAGTPQVAVTSGYGAELELDRDPSGHFRTEAAVNGQTLPFVVDTGADIVALTIDDARRIGIYVDPTSFTVIAEGASGPVRGKEIILDRVEIAGRRIENVRGAVLEGLGRNLLGQSVLTKLGEVEMKGDKMVLR